LPYTLKTKSTPVVRRKLIIAFMLIPIGILTKFYSGFANVFIYNKLGGIVYVIFFIVLSSLLFHKTSPLKLSLIVLCITGLIEFSQLMQTDILIKLRSYFIFRALFGSVFNAFDFLYYILGAVLGFGILKLRYLRNEL
jgi:hypothetical protein